MGGKPLRNRSGEILFIDARKLGRLEDRVHRTLDDLDVARIAGVYHAWRGDEDTEYVDVPGFSKASPLDEVSGHGHVLTPGRYVGSELPDHDGQPFDEKMASLTSTLKSQFAAAADLEESITSSLEGLGFEI